MAPLILLSLAPANLPKSGGRYDLPIAIGLLLASGQIKEKIKIYEGAAYTVFTLTHGTLRQSNDRKPW
jgi:hypothetical protein